MFFQFVFQGALEIFLSLILGGELLKIGMACATKESAKNLLFLYQT